jgi:hypothetical protein
MNANLCRLTAPRAGQDKLQLIKNKQPRVAATKSRFSPKSFTAVAVLFYLSSSIVLTGRRKAAILGLHTLQSVGLRNAGNKR